MKMDPHRHAGGCIQPSFVWNVIQNHSNHAYLADCYEDVLTAMTFSPDEPLEFHRFLDKFRILDEIKWTEDLIDKSIISICDGLEAEKIDYALIDFSINKYMNIGWHRVDAIKFVYEAFKRHRPNKVGLVLSLKYESPQASQRQLARLISNPDIADILVGLDLVGDEAFYNADFYQPLFKEWNDLGKITRAHVGESQSFDNIETAITKLGVTRIAHGIRIIGHPESERVIELAIERGVIFDLAITSNYLTGVVPMGHMHPIETMMRAGLKVTIGTDDPVQCDVSLDSEFEKLQSWGIKIERILNYYKLPSP